MEHRNSIEDAPPGVWYRIADDVSRSHPEEEAWSAHHAAQLTGMFRATSRAVKARGDLIGPNSDFEKEYFKEIPWAGTLIRTARAYGIDI